MITLSEKKFEITDEKAIELVKALLQAMESLTKSDSRLSDKYIDSIRSVQQQLQPTSSTSKGEITPLPKAIKSHTTELPEHVKLESSGRVTNPFSTVNRPTKPFTGQRMAQTKRSSSSSSKRKSQSKATKGGRIKCSLCGYSASDLGALSKHRAKKHPNQVKKSAKKGAQSRKNKPKSAVMTTPYGTFNTNEYIQRAQKLQQQRRSGK